MAAVAFPRERRLEAARFACFERALLDAADRGSFFSAFRRAWERFADTFVFLPLRPFSKSRCAFLRVAVEAVPLFGAGKSTPERRALESPMAIACLLDRAPCLPLRMWSISSRTNSPACVVGALP